MYKELELVLNRKVYPNPYLELYLERVIGIEMSEGGYSKLGVTHTYISNGLLLNLDMWSGTVP